MVVRIKVMEWDYCLALLARFLPHRSYVDAVLIAVLNDPGRAAFLALVVGCLLGVRFFARALLVAVGTATDLDRFFRSFAGG